MEKKSNKKIFIGIVVTVVIVAFFALAIVKSRNDNSGVDAFVNYEVVKEENIESTVFTNGIIVPKETKAVFSEISGKVKTVYVKKGDAVKKGDILAKLDSADIERNIEEAKISLEISKENLKELNMSGKKNFDIALRNSKLYLENAEKKLNDNKVLFESGAISKTTLDAIENEYIRAKNDYESTLRQYSGYGNESKIKVQELTIKSNELALERLMEQLEKTFIKSPIDGVITDSKIKEMDLIAQGTIMFSIEDIKNLLVKTNISEYDINSIKIDQAVLVKSESTIKEYKAKVSEIAPSAISVSNGQGYETVVPVEITILGDVSELKPNFSANVEINTAFKENAKVIPYETIYSDKDGKKYVFLITEEDKLRKVEVELGISGDLVVEVLNDDINVNDKLVLNPTDTLKDGIFVKVSEAIK